MFLIISPSYVSNPFPILFNYVFKSFSNPFSNPFQTLFYNPLQIHVFNYCSNTLRYFDPFLNIALFVPLLRAQRACRDSIGDCHTVIISSTGMPKSAYRLQGGRCSRLSICCDNMYHWSGRNTTGQCHTR